VKLFARGLSRRCEHLEPREKKKGVIGEGRGGKKKAEQGLKAFLYFLPIANTFSFCERRKQKKGSKKEKNQKRGKDAPASH